MEYLEGETIANFFFGVLVVDFSTSAKTLPIEVGDVRARFLVLKWCSKHRRGTQKTTRRINEIVWEGLGDDFC